MKVTVTHIPTKLKESCDTEKSQLANKIKALNMLKAKVWEKTDKLPSNDDEFKFQFD